ncbi:VIT1/CCC1 transporter family protein [Dactylosporangium roseum]|uniref:VIT1/CCC1 transporter family protein n=1 Tax=Dactylosporangium roseum TaxID=47989 RepID=UPI0031D80ACE
MERYRRHIVAERDAAALYRGLAHLSRGRRREAFTELAAIEDRHAEFWAQRLAEHGEPAPDPESAGPSPRVRALLEAARRYSPNVVLPIIEQDEHDGMATYQDDPDAPEHMALEEAAHARVLSALRTDEDCKAGEAWHRSDKSGALRAAVFGVNDGLVSNTALVMGFAGATQQRAPVLLAGLAGMLAGAFSMGAGEFISMANQREAFEREIALERDEIRLLPEDEHRELELIYQAKGLSADEAARIAAQVMARPDVALDTMAREELGLDPDDLGSPWRAAASSFTAFALGAVLVVLPYLFVGGLAALGAGIGIALTALIVVGVVMARINGRPIGRVVARQVVVGVMAAGATYLLGALLGLNLS